MSIVRLVGKLRLNQAYKTSINNIPIYWEVNFNLF